MTLLGIILTTIVPPAIVGLFVSIEEWPEISGMDEMDSIRDEHEDLAD